MFFWGFDFGLGFTTIRVASLYWMVALVALMFASPAAGAAVLGTYGLALVLNLAIGALLFERGGRRIHANIFALRLFQPMRVILATALLGWSTALIALSLWISAANTMA
jgi:hypothetical protein